MLCVMWRGPVRVFFFFNDTATTEIYTLPLRAALPISSWRCSSPASCRARSRRRASRSPPRAEIEGGGGGGRPYPSTRRSSDREEHTSELQSRQYLVCRLLLEKKNPS